MTCEIAALIRKRGGTVSKRQFRQKQRQTQPGSVTSPSTQANGSRRSWTARKSVQARQRIIDSALACFVEIGYHRTTMSEIARKAGVTRGSVQHHFSTTDDVLRAAVDFVYRESLHRYQNLLGTLTGSDDELIDRGVNALWEMTRDPLHVALQELFAAARTSLPLRTVLDDIARDGEKRYREWTLNAYPRFARFSVRDFHRARDFTRIFLEGLSRWSFHQDDRARLDGQLALLKKMLRLYWVTRPGAAASGIGSTASAPDHLSAVQCHRLAELVREASAILGATGLDGTMQPSDPGGDSGNATGSHL